MSFTKNSPDGKTAFDFDVSSRSFTVYEADHFIKLPVSDPKTGAKGDFTVETRDLLLLANIINEQHPIPSVGEVQLLNRLARADLSVIPCTKESKFRIENKYAEIDHRKVLGLFGYGNNEFNNHDRFFHRPKGEDRGHSHFLPTDGHVSEHDLHCLLNKIEYFNRHAKQPLISSDDIKQIINDYNTEARKLNRVIKNLAKNSANSFIQIAVSSFCLDLFGRYFIPLLIFNFDSLSISTKNKVIDYGKNLLLAFQMLYSVINATQLSVGLVLQVISNIIKLFNINISISPQMISLFKVFEIILVSDTTESAANALGAELGFVVGGVSAKILGEVLSSRVIKLLPKLKEEAAEEEQEDKSNDNNVPQSPTMHLRK